VHDELAGFDHVAFYQPEVNNEAVDAVFNYLGLDDSLIVDLRLIKRDVIKPGKLVMHIREAA